MNYEIDNLSVADEKSGVLLLPLGVLEQNK